jgi:hypothetical protein
MHYSYLQVGQYVVRHAYDHTFTAAAARRTPQY